MNSLAELPRDTAVRTALVFLLLVFGWMVFVVYALHGSFPSNALVLPFEKTVHVKRWFSQHWAFFTEDARDLESVRYYQKTREGNWVLVSAAPRFSVANDLGFIRRGWSLGMEATNLMNQLPEGAYHPCSGDALSCLDRTPGNSHLMDDHPMPTLCGEIAFITTRPVPWAWVSAGAPASMPSTVARASVSCK